MNVTHNLFNTGIIIHLPSGHVMSFTVHSYKLNQFLFWISSVILIHKLELKKKNKQEGNPLYVRKFKINSKRRFCTFSSLEAGAPYFKLILIRNWARGSRTGWRTKEKVAFGGMKSDNVGKWRKYGKLCSMYFIRLLCEVVLEHEQLWVNDRPSVGSIFSKREIIHCANNTQLSLIKNDYLTLSQWRLVTQVLLFRILWRLIVTVNRKCRQIPHKFASLPRVFIASIIIGKQTSPFRSL